MHEWNDDVRLVQISGLVLTRVLTLGNNFVEKIRNIESVHL